MRRTHNSDFKTKIAIDTISGIERGIKGRSTDILR